MTDIAGWPFDSKFLIACIAVLVAGFLRGFVGFGAALISVPVLNVLYGPLIAVPVSNLIGLPAVILLFPDAVRFSERAIVSPVCLAIFAAAPIGAWLLVGTDPKIMKVVISMLVIVMVCLLLRGWTLKATPTLRVLISAGVAGGLIQGSAGVGGPPVVAVALARVGEAVQQRGNILALMAAIGISSLLPFAVLGLFTEDVIVLALLLFPMYVTATWFGSHYFSGTGKRHFRSAAMWLLLAIAITTLWMSVEDYRQNTASAKRNSAASVDAISRAVAMPVVAEGDALQTRVGSG